jgi:hypothetical protein
LLRHKAAVDLVAGEQLVAAVVQVLRIEGMTVSVAPQDAAYHAQVGSLAIDAPPGPSGQGGAGLVVHGVLLAAVDVVAVRQGVAHGPSSGVEQNTGRDRWIASSVAKRLLEAAAFKIDVECCGVRRRIGTKQSGGEGKGGDKLFIVVSFVRVLMTIIRTASRPDADGAV